MNQIITRASIDEICDRRDEALRLFGEAFEAISAANDKLQAAHAMVRQAAPTSTGMAPSDSDEVKAFHAALRMPDGDRWKRVAKRLTDATIWAYIVERTDLERLMDAQAKKELRDQMRYVPERAGRDGELINQDEIDRGMPEVTVDNVAATLEKFRADADMIWKRGIANAFSKLDRSFRSHDGWKIGNRMILTYFCDAGLSGSVRYEMEAVLMDVERAFSILDGEEARASYGGIVGAIRNGRSGRGYGPKASEHESRYFKVRIFKNGNAHLWMKRHDLVAKVNKILGEYYGEAIGDNENVPQNADPLKNAKTTLAKNYGFFPTPAAVAEIVFEYARIYAKNEGPQMTVLEPSAGSGNLSRVAAAPLTLTSERKWNSETKEWIDQVTSSRKATVDVVEIHEERTNALHLHGLYRKIYQHDFLNLRPEMTGQYDRIVMNPPFDRERDIDHVVHALKFLKNDGVLVSVMSAGTELRETKKSAAFRKMIADRGGWFRDLPERSFAECGTNVNTIVCVVGRKHW